MSTFYGEMRELAESDIGSMFWMSLGAGYDWDTTFRMRIDPPTEWRVGHRDADRELVPGRRGGVNDRRVQIELGRRPLHDLRGIGLTGSRPLEDLIGLQEMSLPVRRAPS